MKSTRIQIVKETVHLSFETKIIIIILLLLLLLIIIIIIIMIPLQNGMSMDIGLLTVGALCLVFVLFCSS